MANLASVLATQQLVNKSHSIKCVKTRKDLNIVAAVSDDFFFVRVPLDKISLSASTQRNNAVIIIDKNELKIGRTASGFIPKISIVQGHDKVTAAKANGDLFIDVWAGTKAIKKLHIMADDAISSNELQTKLSILIAKNYHSKNTSGSDYSIPCGGGPWIREIYPFENYVIFDWNGDSMKQAYVLDPITRNVALAGKPVKVYQEYEEVPKGLTSDKGRKAQMAENIIESAAAIPVMPSNRSVQYYTTTFSQEQDFDPINSSDKPLGMVPGSGGQVDSITFGAPSSEYANTPLKTMMNIEEALRMYLDALVNGTHVPMPSAIFNANITASRYPNEFAECKIAAEEANAKIDIVDFLRWQTRELNATKKLKNGLSASCMATVGDIEDTSTWEMHAKDFSQDRRKKMAKEGTAKPDGSYPIASPKDVENAVKDFHRASGSPSDKAHIKKRAKALGLGNPFKKKEVDADAVTNALPGGYRPPPMQADAEMAQGIVAKKKKVKIKADMNMPMPTVSPTPPSTSNISSGGPGSGRKPGFSGKADKDHANDLHDELTSKGFKYQFSTGDLKDRSKGGEGVKVHYYGNDQGKTGKIIETPGSVSKYIEASFQPNAGRKKFKISDKVTTKYGKGRISDNEASKDHVEVTHHSGKVAIMHKNDVQKAGK